MLQSEAVNVSQVREVADEWQQVALKMHCLLEHHVMRVVMTVFY